MLVKALFCLMLSLFTVVSHAQAPLNSHDQIAYEQILEKYPSLPQSEKDLIHKTVLEMKETLHPALNDYLLSSTQDEVKHFIRILKNEAHPDDLEILFRSLNNRKGTFLKFMDQIALEVQKNPEIRAKFMSRLKSIEKHLGTRKANISGVGTRFLNTGLMVAGMGGYLYGMELMLPAAERAGVVSAISPTFSAFIAGFIGLTITGEVLAIKKAWNNLSEHLKEQRDAKARIKEFQKIVQLMTSEQLAQAIRKQIKFSASVAGETAATKAAPEISKAITAEIEHLSSKPATLNFLRSFVLSKQYKSLIHELENQMTETELRELREKYIEHGFKVDQVPLSVQDKMQAFEFMSIRYFKRFLDAGEKNSTGELRMEILRLKKIYLAEHFSAPIPNWRVHVGNTSTSIGIAILGVITAVGNNPTPADAYFSLEMANWIRDNTRFLHNVAGAFCIPSIYFFHERLMRIPRYAQTVMDKLTSEHKLQRLEHLERLINERKNIKDQSAIRLSKQDADKLITGKDFIETLISIKDSYIPPYAEKAISALPLKCSAVHSH